MAGLSLLRGDIHHGQIGGVILAQIELIQITLDQGLGLFTGNGKGDGGEYHGAGLAVPANLQTQGVGHGPHRQIGGAVHSEGLHHSAVGVSEAEEGAVQGDLDIGVVGLEGHADGTALGGDTGGLGGDLAAAGEGHGAGVSLPLHIQAQGASHSPHRQVGGAIHGKGLHGLSVGVSEHQIGSIQHHLDVGEVSLDGLGPGEGQGITGQAGGEGQGEQPAGEAAQVGITHGIKLLSILKNA